MTEIKTPIKQFEEVTIITDDHTLRDILRWMRDESGGDFEEIKAQIADMEEGND